MPAPVTYANDVRPLFRPGDINCMTPRGINIGDSAWMCSAAAAYGFPDHGNARHVFEKIDSDDMPPDQPWDGPTKAIYQAWMIGGFLP